MKGIRFLLYPALICLINSLSLPSLSAPGDSFQIRNRRSGLCLDVPDGRSENHLGIQQYDCREPDDSWMPAQLWQLREVGSIPK